MNVEQYLIFRVTNNTIRNEWNEVIFDKDVIVQAIYDMGDVWLAKPMWSNSVPRMLPKSECRELTETERKLLIKG